MLQYDVVGKVAFVTGAARGIGFETARLLHGRGALVALADLDGDEVERAAAQLGTDRTLALALRCAARFPRSWSAGVTSS